jgi:two-component system sensor histidine kinase BaeS
MTRSLLWKLVGINTLIIAFVIIIVWMSVDYLAAGYFVTLMEKYNISPVSSHRMFISAVHRYLIWATIGALGLAFCLNFLVMRRVLGPLKDMAHISKKIASGDYSDKAPVKSRDEVGQLALSFNQMAESLRKMDMLRKRMVIDVAHELRTPLTNVRGYLEALMDGVVSPSKETFHLLHEETLRLAELVEDILSLAKADVARDDLHKTDTYMADLVSQAMESFLPQFNAKRITVETHFPEQKHPLLLDHSKIIQVVVNLLQNALQYTPQDGVVRIHITQSPGEMRVAFTNSGVELSEKDLPLIFERFFRGEKSRSREHGGAGIGLAIAKELVEAHSGHVGAETSDNATTVWFSIPVQ